MKLPFLPPNEAERLRALHQYRILDTLPEQVYEDLTRLAAQVCEAPIALVSLIDAERQWFKSRLGLDLAESDRAISFCAHSVASGEMLVVRDAHRDDRFADNPFVLQDPHIRFYAGTPLFTPDGHALGTLCVIDREPRELSDGQIAMLQALGRQVMSQLDLRLCMAEREHVERAMNDFVSVVSHELRTPLTSIRGSLGLIEGGALGEVPPKMSPLVQIARANTDRLIRLVNNTLDLQKMEAGRLELQSATLEVATLLEAAVEGMRGIAETAGVRLAWDVDPGVSGVQGDLDRLTQVLINLLSNAIKVSPAGALVQVRAEPAPFGRVRLSVIDAGPGIREEDVPRLFGKFQQIDAESRARGGTGLGLAICKGIVEEHGGRIGVVTRSGEGSRFWFEIHAPASATGATESVPVESGDAAVSWS